MTIDLRKYYLGSSDELEWDLELSGMELGGVKPFCAPVKVRGQLKGSPDSVELSGTAVYTMTMPCDRCFELTTQERELSFFHVLVRALSDEEDDNGELVVVPDDQLDLDQRLSEHILREVPSSGRCAPGCPGRCPTCGAQGSGGPCGGVWDTVDPRLAVLKDLL